MSQPQPFRQRPNLHLALTQLTGSPRHSSQFSPSSTPLTSRLPTPSGTPFGTTSYSPFRSASLKLPSQYNSTTHLAPRRPSYSSHEKPHLFRFRRLLASKPIWLLLMFAALVFWWLNGGSEELDEVKLSAKGLGKDFLRDRRMQDFQFYPATNPKIHASQVQ